MEEKRNAIVTAAMIVFILIFLGLADVIEIPGLKGEYTAEENDFVGQHKWEQIKLSVEMLGWKKEIKNNYIGDGKTLIVKHDPIDYKDGLNKDKLDELRELEAECSITFALIPNADNALEKLMPWQAPHMDETPVYEAVREIFDDKHYIDFPAFLSDHYMEKIYGNTTDNLTNTGYYYLYLAWIKHENRYPMYTYKQLLQGEKTCELYESGEGFKRFKGSTDNEKTMLIILDKPNEYIQELFGLQFENVIIVNRYELREDLREFVAANSGVLGSKVLIIADAENFFIKKKAR